MNFLKYLITTFGLVLISTQNTWAYDAMLSVGNLCEYVEKIQTNDAGKTNFCSFNPYISGSIDYAFIRPLVITPQAGFTLPHAGRDTNISKMDLFVLMNVKYFWYRLQFTIGAGFLYSRISGPGGEEVLNNGNSTTSFPLPDSAVYARNFIYNLGAGVRLTRSFGAEVHAYVFNANNSEDRAFSLGANITYHFGAF